MYSLLTKFIVLFFLFFLLINSAQAQISLDIETGLVFPGYNKVRIPNDQGTTFDFNSDFETQGAVFPLRIRPGYSFGKNHIFGLFAPLRVRYQGQPGLNINFQNSQFDGNRPIDGFYKFNSYRLTYRRDLIQNERWVLGLGFTAKIRDAQIKLSDNSITDFKDDLGFVPLLHLFVSYDSGPLSILLEGDGLAGGPGRAFDFFGGVRVPFSNYFSLKAGYRILEGGADVPDVYNFALFNFVSMGIIWGFN